MAGREAPRGPARLGGLALRKGAPQGKWQAFTASIDTVGGDVTMRPFANSPAMVGEFTRER